MWNDQPPLDHIATSTCGSKVGNLSPWILVDTHVLAGPIVGDDILDDPSVLVGPIDGKSLNNYVSSVTRKMDPIELLMLNDGRMTPPNSYSESSPEADLAVRLEKKHLQTPEIFASFRTSPSNPMHVTPSRSRRPPNLNSRLIHPVRSEMSSEMARRVVTPSSAKLNYGKTKISYDGVECVKVLDLKETPQTNGRHCVVSNIEARTKYSKIANVASCVTPCNSCSSLDENTKSDLSKASRPKKRRRIKEPTPAEKTYVEEDEIKGSDVLCGRGGRSNSHPGNKAYRDKLLKDQSAYKRLDIAGKREMIEDAVLWVKNDQNGRFLAFEEPTGRFFIASDKQARAKVSQYLREDHTPEGRQEKKARLTAC